MNNFSFRAVALTIFGKLATESTMQQIFSKTSIALLHKPEFFSKLGIQSEEILDGRTDILLPQTTGTDSNPRGPCHLGKGRHRESTMEGTAVTESKRQNAPVFHPV